MITKTTACLLPMALSISIMSFGQDTPSAISLVLDPPQKSYKVGEPIQLTFLETNVSGRNVDITVSPGKRNVTYICMALVKSLGVEASNQYSEPQERESLPHVRSFFGTTLAPNASLHMYFNLIERYRVDKAGTYSIKLGCGYSDNIPSFPTTNLSNAITLTLTDP